MLDLSKLTNMFSKSERVNGLSELKRILATSILFAVGFTPLRSIYAVKLSVSILLRFIYPSICKVMQKIHSAIQSLSKGLVNFATWLH